MSSKKIGLAIIGTGMAAKPHALALNELKDNINVVGVFSRNKEKRENFSKNYNFDTFQDIDSIYNNPEVEMVDIITPPNIHISDNVGTGATAYAVTTSMATALTANASSSYRTVIHSIHVANISSSEVTVSGEMQSSFSFAHTIPIPAGSAVELLKQPKVLGASETIELQASANSALQATIIAEQKEDTDLWDAQVDITSAATWTDLYTSTSNPSVVQSILLANDDGTNDVKARVVWTNGSDTIQAYLCYDLIVPADSTVELCEQPKYLASGYKLRVYANQADRLEVTASGKQITS